MSRVVVFGAGGPLGAAVTEELVSRGHAVTGVTRSGNGTVAGDASDAAAVAELVRGADVVVNAVGPRRGSDPQDLLVRVAHGLIDGLRKAGVTRLVVVGGAGSLREGDRMHLDASLPVAYRPVAVAHVEARDVYFTATDLDWTYVSPPSDIHPGARTGTFRKGGDALLVDADGRSAISDADYAIGVVDEIEAPASVRQQITFAY